MQRASTIVFCFKKALDFTLISQIHTQQVVKQNAALSLMLYIHMLLI